MVNKRLDCKPGAKANWTHKKCRLLIQEIKTNECLWNVMNKDYKNSLVRYLAWEHVSLVVGVYVDEAKTRWDGLRNTFRVS